MNSSGAGGTNGGRPVKVKSLLEENTNLIFAPYNLYDSEDNNHSIWPPLSSNDQQQQHPNHPPSLLKQAFATDPSLLAAEVTKHGQSFPNKHGVGGVTAAGGGVVVLSHSGSYPISNTPTTTIPLMSNVVDFSSAGYPPDWNDISAWPPDKKRSYLASSVDSSTEGLRQRIALLDTNDQSYQRKIMGRHVHDELSQQQQPISILKSTADGTHRPSPVFSSPPQPLTSNNNINKQKIKGGGSSTTTTATKGGGGVKSIPLPPPTPLMAIQTSPPLVPMCPPYYPGPPPPPCGAFGRPMPPTVPPYLVRGGGYGDYSNYLLLAAAASSSPTSSSSPQQQQPTSPSAKSGEPMPLFGGGIHQQKHPVPPPLDPPRPLVPKAGIPALIAASRPLMTRQQLLLHGYH